MKMLQQGASVKMTGVEDKKEILALIEKEDGLKEAIQPQKAGPE